MSRKFILVLFVLLLSACGNEGSQSSLKTNTEADQTTQTDKINYLFENESFKVADLPGWIESEDPITNENIIFQNGKLKAIVTVVSNDKSLEEIKNELKVSFRSVEDIEETDDYVSFRTNRQESIRTDIYLSRGEEQTGILIFMVPDHEFETNKNKIEEFKNNLEFL